MKSSQPKFEQNATKTLDVVRSTFQERGAAYGDTWGHCQFLVMRATAKKLGILVPDDCFRALATAAFVDMKYQRFEGSFKEDNLTDGIAYMAYLRTEMEELTHGR